MTAGRNLQRHIDRVRRREKVAGEASAGENPAWLECTKMVRSLDFQISKTQTVSKEWRGSPDK